MSNNSRPTQCDKIMRHFMFFGGITQAEAINDYGIMRLASRISEMKKKGIAIRKEYEHGKNRFGEPCSWVRYYLDNNE